MIYYALYDDDEHPIAEGATKKELANKLGVTPNAVYNAYARGNPHYQTVEDIEEDEEWAD